MSQWITWIFIVNIGLWGLIVTVIVILVGYTILIRITPPEKNERSRDSPNKG